jgi:PAS domain S-box-containing protein
MSSASLDDAALRLATVPSFDSANITLDLSGTITSWDRAAEPLFGYTGAEATGQSVGLIISSLIRGRKRIACSTARGAHAQCLDRELQPC